MGRKEESKAAINSLYNHALTVDEACYDKGGTLEYQESNFAAIKALSTCRLAYMLDDDLGYQLHSSVKNLLDRATSRYRFREKHGAFSSLIENLEHAVDNYRRCQRKGATNTTRYLDEIREITVEMIDALSETVTMFHQVVANEFSVVSDIDEKIRQTTRCKNEIAKINGVFQYLTVKKLREWVQTDLMLERLLMKLLKQRIDSTLKDLDSANGKFVEMLDKLQKDQLSVKHNNLIDAFARKFSGDASFTPSIVHLDELPEQFAIASTMECSGYADLGSQLFNDELVEAAKKIVRKVGNANDKKSQINSPIDFVDDRGEEIQQTLDPVDEALEMLFDAINDESFRGKLSALESHEKLKVPVSIEDWLLLVANYYEAQRHILVAMVEVEEVSNILPPYDGNVFVYDIVFRRRELYGK